jgi:hypothetical protein
MTNPSPAISRRHFLATAAATTTATFLRPRSLWAHQAPAQPAQDFLTKARASNVNNKITTTPLRRNVSALLGVGGNIAVLTAKEGKLLIDSGYASCQPQLAAALTAINAG